MRYLGLKHCGSRFCGQLTFSMGKNPLKPNGTALWCTTDISVSYLDQAHVTKEMMEKIAPWIPRLSKRKSWKTRQIKEMAIKTTRKSLRPVRATESYCDNWQEILRGRDPISCNQTAQALVKTEREMRFIMHKHLLPIKTFWIQETADLLYAVSLLI